MSTHLEGLTREEKVAKVLEITIETMPKLSILRFFRFAHLPPNLRLISAHFADVACFLAVQETAHPAEQATALRKLLEAKDAAVRAALP